MVCFLSTARIFINLKLEFINSQLQMVEHGLYQRVVISSKCLGAIWQCSPVIGRHQSEESTGLGLQLSKQEVTKHVSLVKPGKSTKRIKFI